MQSKKIYAQDDPYEEYRRFAFITDVRDELAVGHKKVKELLQPTLDGDLPLIVDESCKNVDISFRRYKYKEYGGKRAEEMALSEMLEGKYKHFMDLIRYDAMVPFIYRPCENYYGNYQYRTYQRTGWRSKVIERPPGINGR